MSLRVYNTLSKEKEVFQPVTPGKVGIYLCGPTVYKSPHIGHMVGPVIFDAIKRYLVYKGFEVTWVVNITDVDDKLIVAAAKQKMSVVALAEKHTKEYLDALAALGVEGIDHFPKASDHIPEMIEIMQRLIDKGAAYPSDGNVWFDVSKDADYGKLSNRKIDDQESGLRQLEGAGKRNPSDFALWKAAKPGEPMWDSPWGQGRPGWHIECSAMSAKFLGETFDMHGGGMDLLFPHHENELAQSETATGKPFARFWMHNGLTRVRTKSKSGEWVMDDMHESSGNAVRVQELIAKHGAELIRYLLLSTQYRRPINFADDVIVASRKGIGTFYRLFERVERMGVSADVQGPNLEAISATMLESENEHFVKAVMALKMKFLDSMDDDFNTAGAIGVLHELASEINGFIERSKAESDRPPDAIESAAAAVQTLKGLGALLGLFRTARLTEAPATDSQAGTTESLMQLIIELRKSARDRKDFTQSDAIRDGLKKLGIVIEDRPGGATWRKD